MIKPTSFFSLLLFPILSYTQSNIEAVLESFKKDKDLQHATYSFCDLEAQTGKTVKEYNSEIALIPASTMKIMTTSAALGILGKDYTYKTNFYTLTKIDSASGTSTNNLLIKGSGDPSFNSSYFYNSDGDFFNPILEKIKAKNTLMNIFDMNFFFESIKFDYRYQTTCIKPNLATTSSPSIIICSLFE